MRIATTLHIANRSITYAIVAVDADIHKCTPQRFAGCRARNTVPCFYLRADSLSEIHPNGIRRSESRTSKIKRDTSRFAIRDRR